MLQPFKDHLQIDGMITIAIRVRPNAPATMAKQILSDGSVKIDLAAAAEDGKANEELIAYLSEEFEVSREQVTVISGQTSRRKLVRIEVQSS